MPYAALLHGPTRESLGVQLKDAIIVIDEAHNLIETVNQIHSAALTQLSLSQAHSQVSILLTVVNVFARFIFDSLNS